MRCYWEIAGVEDIPDGMAEVPSAEVGAQPLEMLYAIIEEVGEEVDEVKLYRGSDGTYFARITGPGGETIFVRKCTGSSVGLFLAMGAVVGASGAGIGYAVGAGKSAAIGGAAGLAAGLLGAYYYSKVQTGGVGFLSGCKSVGNISGLSG